MKVINLFGGPGTGKSTTAAGVFNRMKIMGLNVELTNEYAKDMVWEGRDNVLNDQLYILAKQHRKLLRLKDKVDWVVMDSPIILGLSYTSPDYFKSFEPLVMDLWNSYDNVNFLLERSFDYQPIGRIGDETNAKRLDNEVRSFLDSKGVVYHTIGIEQFNEDVVSTILSLAKLSAK